MKVVSCANVVLFGKLLPKKQLNILRRVAGQRVTFVFITPYKPVLNSNASVRQATEEHLDCFDEIWVQDRQFKKDLRGLGFAKKISVIPYMPEHVTLPEAEAFHAGVLRIGFLGRLVEDKNLPLLFKAFQLLIQHANLTATDPEHNFKLELFGDGPLREDLEKLAQNLGIDPFVQFHGAIPQREVRDAVNSCQLFVFTSHVEGQCLAALEILGAGRPVVATDAGAFPDILKDKRLGELVLEKTPESVFRAIRRIRDDLLRGELNPGIVHMRRILNGLVLN